MIASVDSLFDQALSLPEESRQELADRLCSSLHADEDDDLDPAHLATVIRRMEEVESGKVATIDGDEALRRIRDIARDGR